MLFNSNVKLLLVLLLAVVLIYMLNSKEEIPNDGEVEALSEEHTSSLPETTHDGMRKYDCVFFFHEEKANENAD